MSLETTQDLEQETIDALQDLIQINLDSARGFGDAAKQVQAENLKVLFTDLALNREQNLAELQEYVEMNGERACAEGSIAAAFHRAWMDFRGRLSGGDSLVILSEAERGEDHIKAAYEEALVHTAGSPLNSVLTRQYLSVKAGHNKVRDLRDGYK